MKELEQIIEEKIWERHEGCKIKSDEYKEYPEECCYKHCAEAIEQFVIKAREEYNELILAVGNKYPNETRHQTALRYIKQAEESCGTAKLKKGLK